MTDRRYFIRAVAGSLIAVPLFARAQKSALPVIGYLYNGKPPIPPEAPFHRSLRALGWIEGQNVTIEYRFAEGNPDRYPALIAELVQAKVDVIMLSGSQAIRAAQGVTSTVPIVFVVLVDPVAAGFVQSLARPGGNMTGLASQFEELIAKQLQLLKEAVPNLARVALLHHPDSGRVLTAAETAARSLGLTVRTINVAGVAEFEDAFKLARIERAGAIHVLPSPIFTVQRARLIELAAKYRLPACYEFRNFVQDGGLMSYGPSINDMTGRAATYVDKILKGAAPASLPVEQPTKFELVVNLKTAKSLGLTIPQSLLLRADEVIQ